MRRYHAKGVRGREFSIRDLVLHLTQSNKGRHKLTPPWEGPYVMAEILGPRMYKLKDTDERTLTNTWNIEKLRHFYP